jgi:trehalose-phosphatase
MAVASNADAITIDDFMGAVARAPGSALLLDYDGTLAPFCLHREQAVPYAGVTALLQQIVRQGRTRVVIITGRNAREVMPLLAIRPSLEVFGCHGLERLLADGSRVVPRVEETVIHALAAARHWLRDWGLEHRAELKTGAIAIHWRGLDEAAAERTRARVLHGWMPIAQRTPMHLLEFDGGVEMRMPGVDKGDAIRTILAEVGGEAPVAYLGDDLTDESAFAALGTRGLSVLVRPEWRESAAAHWIRPPRGLMDFLTRWAKASGVELRTLPPRQHAGWHNGAQPR